MKMGKMKMEDMRTESMPDIFYTPFNMKSILARKLILKSAFAMVLVIAVLAATNGEWLTKASHVAKDYLLLLLNMTDLDNSQASLQSEEKSSNILRSYRLEGVFFYVSVSVTVSFVTFYSMGYWLTQRYYINQRDKVEEWKCQPSKFLTYENEKHEFIVGSVNMLVGATLSGLIVTHVMNGGTTALYFNMDERGWLYLLVSIPVLLLYMETAAYYLHRMYHVPVLYRHIHKWHHRYGAPTIYSATAMHPVEFFTYQGYLMLPIFVGHVYVGVYIAILLYIYYYGMRSHSGIISNPIWPWQPSSMFHDDHHRYFHCNFGNLYLFDWLHDTLRRKDRIYGEDVFGGHGVKRESKVT